MTFAYRDGVALLQLLVFVPTVPVAVLMCVRHGWSSSSGWRFLLVFILLRIAGAIAQLVTISHPTYSAYATVVVCNSIGLSPLNILCIGFLSRLNDQITRRLPSSIFKAIELLSLAGFILAIVGGSAFKSSQGSFGVNPVSRAAFILFIVVFTLSVALFGMILTRTNGILPGERRLLIVIGIAQPLILVRMVYALLFLFGRDIKWNNSFGNVTIYLCMAVLEEIAVVLVALGIGITLKRLPKPVAADTEDGFELQQHNDKAGSSETPDEPARKKAKGPVTFLYYTIQRAIQQRRRSQR